MAIVKMKDFAPTHRQLVKRIATWYKNRHQSCIVLAEFVTAAQEIPDVIVFESGAHTVLLECKASRSDFLSDKHKFFRRQEDYGMGEHRYYVAPHGMIQPDELPEGWGLYEVDERCVREKVEAKGKQANKTKECCMLMSALRRLEISTCVFVRHDSEIEERENSQHPTIGLAVQGQAPSTQMPNGQIDNSGLALRQA